MQRCKGQMKGFYLSKWLYKNKRKNKDNNKIKAQNKFNYTEP